MPGGKEWIEVTGRRRRQHNASTGRTHGKLDVAHGGWEKQSSNRNSVSFFFTEFPDDFHAKEMWDVFKKFGDVDEVVIPPKRDKRGKRFGFVRFFGVRDPSFFAIKLDNIIIGSKKMFVNLPRFQREGMGGASQKYTGAGHAPTNAPRSHVKQSWRNDEKSYACAVKKGVRDGGGRGVPYNKGLKSCNYAHLKFHVNEERIKKCSSAFIGKVAKVGTSYEIQEEFYRHGLFSIKAIPMGSNLVLLEAENVDDVPALVNDEKEWLLEWFDEIRAWSPKEIDSERIAWIRCYGVPYHAWTEEFFSFLVSAFGEFICLDDNTKNKGSMDVARVMYRTRVHDLVNRIIKIDINGDVFSIKIVEDWYGPLQWNHSHKRLFSDDSSSSDEESLGGNMKFQGEEELKGVSDDEVNPGLDVNQVTKETQFNDDNVLCGNGTEAKKSKVLESGTSAYSNNEQPKVLESGTSAYSNNEQPSSFNEAFEGVHQVESSLVGLKTIDSNVEVGFNCASAGINTMCDESGPIGNNMQCADSGPIVSLVKPSVEPPPTFASNSPHVVQGVSPIEANLEPQLSLVPYGSDPKIPSGSGTLPPICPYAISYCFPDENQRIILSRTSNGTRSCSFSTNGSSRFSGGSVLCSDSVGDSDIRRCNDKFWENHEAAMAKKIWENAKALGVHGCAEDAVYINKIGAMEARDCLAKSQRE